MPSPSNNDAIGKYGTPEYNQLLKNMRVSIRRLEMTEAEEALYPNAVPGHVVRAQSEALIAIKQAAIALSDYYARLGNANDIPF